MARPVSWRVFLPATIGAIAVPFAIGYFFMVLVMFPKPKVEGGHGIPVPELVGHTYADALVMLSNAHLGALDTMLVPSQDAPAGTVLAQDPLAGQEARQGSRVSVSISAGAAHLRVPDVAGFSAEGAQDVLQKMGFTTQRTEEWSDAPRGMVVRLQPAAGTSVQLPAAVTIVVSAGSAPVDTVMTQDTLPFADIGR